MIWIYTSSKMHASASRPTYNNLNLQRARGQTMAAVARNAANVRCGKTSADETCVWAAQLVDDMFGLDGPHAFQPCTAMSKYAPSRAKYVKSVVVGRATPHGGGAGSDIELGDADVLPYDTTRTLLVDTFCVLSLARPVPWPTTASVYGVVWRGSARDQTTHWQSLFASGRNGIAMLRDLAYLLRRSPGKRYVRLDIARFFARVRITDVQRALLEAMPAGLCDADAGLYRSCVRRVDVVLRENSHDGVRGLPVGLCASHLLAEVVLRPLDAALSRNCASGTAKYMRFLDDVHIVGDDAAVEAMALRATDVVCGDLGLSWNEAKSVDTFVPACADDLLDEIHVPRFLETMEWDEPDWDDTSLDAQYARLCHAVQMHNGPYYGQDGYIVADIAAADITRAAICFVRVMCEDSGRVVELLEHIARRDAVAAHVLVPTAALCLSCLQHNKTPGARASLAALAVDIVRDCSGRRGEHAQPYWLRSLRHIVRETSCVQVVELASAAAQCSADLRSFVCGVIRDDILRRLQPGRSREMDDADDDHAAAATALSAAAAMLTGVM